MPTPETHSHLLYLTSEKAEIEDDYIYMTI
jgi:hypothetical protein